MSRVTICLEDDSLTAAARANMSVSKWFAQFADAEKQKPVQSWDEFFAGIDRLRDEGGDDFPSLIIVRCELAFGLKKRPSQRLQAALNAQLAGLIVLPLDEAVVAHYARVRAHLESKGTPVGPNDALIAAHALALDATLVSADAEFLRVPGLRVENWFDAKIAA